MNSKENSTKTLYTVTSYEHCLKDHPQYSSQFKRYGTPIVVSRDQTPRYRVKAEFEDINKANDLYVTLNRLGVMVFKNYIL